MTRMEMPPLPLVVLDGLADDIESVESLRDHGEVAPYGLALVDEQDVVDALRELLTDGLVQAWELTNESEFGFVLIPVSGPATDDQSLRSYWFRWTPAGERAWREGHDALDAYFDAHPSGG
jgi:hypothetical protein